jgi:hypothetical protein
MRDARGNSALLSFGESRKRFSGNEDLCHIESRGLNRFFTIARCDMTKGICIEIKEVFGGAACRVCALYSEFEEKRRTGFDR